MRKWWRSYADRSIITRIACSSPGLSRTKRRYAPKKKRSLGHTAGRWSCKASPRHSEELEGLTPLPSSCNVPAAL